MIHAKGNGKVKDESKGGLTKENVTVNVYMCAYLSHTCYLQITMICVWVINKPCAREIKYMRLIAWIRHRGSKHKDLALITADRMIFHILPDYLGPIKKANEKNPFSFERYG